MRTIEEVRRREIEAFAESVRRPQMFACPHCLEGTIRGFLYTLCFLDENGPRVDRVEFQKIRRPGLEHCHGTYGALGRYMVHPGGFMDEVGSMYAEIGHALGYVTLDRTLSDAEYAVVRKTARAMCCERDWTIGEVRERFGSPSWGGTGRTVLSYAPASPETGWVHFDFWVPGYERASDERLLLRNVRLPTAQFGRGLVFTPSGRAARRRVRDAAEPVR